MSDSGENQPVYTDENRRAVLMVMRIIWLALVVGQIGFGAVVIFMIRQAGPSQQSHLTGQMFAIACGVFIGAVGLGYFLRNQSYKKHWHEHAVAPPGYFQGNLILLALLESSSFLTLVLVMLHGEVFPLILPAVASLAVQCANYPSPLPMQPHAPELGDPSP